MEHTIFAVTRERKREGEMKVAVMETWSQSWMRRGLGDEARMETT